MKKNIIVTSIFLMMTTTFLSAQQSGESAVAAAVEQLRKAMIDADKAVLDQLTSEKLSYGHSSGVIESKTEFIEKIASGKSDFVTIELKDQVISISGKTALVRHRLDATTNDSGKPGEAHLFVLLVFQKEKKQWKLLARQATKVPL
jgi:ketosteroid isomerase-like protein